MTILPFQVTTHLSGISIALKFKLVLPVPVPTSTVIVKIPLPPLPVQAVDSMKVLHVVALKNSENGVAVGVWVGVWVLVCVGVGVGGTSHPLGLLYSIISTLLSSELIHAPQMFAPLEINTPPEQGTIVPWLWPASTITKNCCKEAKVEKGVTQFWPTTVYHTSI